eukprot:scaffold855_cov344-Prasinococcus_capsulatus_cf.AAC.21
MRVRGLVARGAWARCAAHTPGRCCVVLCCAVLCVCEGGAGGGGARPSAAPRPPPTTPQAGSMHCSRLGENAPAISC